MKKIYSIILVLILSLNITAQNGKKFAEESVAIDTFKVLTPNKFYSKVDQIVTTLLTRYHYKKIDLNDSLSSIIFDNYFEALDYNKVYFLKSDLDKYENFRYLLDDLLLQGNLTIP
jgi:carboxyl-terminal processing protease